MPRIDKIKEQIAWLKVVFGILSAVDVSLVGWLANNYDKVDINKTKIYLGTLIALLIAAVIVYVNKKAMKKIDELEDLRSRLLFYSLL